jgi:hypothetical protein
MLGINRKETMMMLLRDHYGAIMAQFFGATDTPNYPDFTGCVPQECATSLSTRASKKEGSMDRQQVLEDIDNLIAKTEKEVAPGIFG